MGLGLQDQPLEGLVAVERTELVALGESSRGPSFARAQIPWHCFSYPSHVLLISRLQEEGLLVYDGGMLDLDFVWCLLVVVPEAADRLARHYRLLDPELLLLFEEKLLI